MNRITHRSALLRTVLVAAFAGLFAVGCAATGDEPVEEGTEKSTTEGVAAHPAEDLPADALDFDSDSDKGLRKDYCCAQKVGSKVLECNDLFGTKTGMALLCRAPASDNVLRDGVCEQYESCRGKILPFTGA